MAVYPFYDWHDIDDANIGCHNIIVSECDWSHVYMDPCVLMQECMATLPAQLTSDCVVAFLNNLDSQNVWDFLRIDSSFCIEAVPLNLIQSDRLVSVDNTDIPGELQTKIVWCWDITVTPIGPPLARQLEICYTGPRTFPDLLDVPSNVYDVCNPEGTNAFLWKYLMVNDTHNWVKSVCTYKPIGVMYLTNDITITGSVWDRWPPSTPGDPIWKNKTVHFFLWNTTNYTWDNWLTTDVTAMNVIGWLPTVRVGQTDRSWLWRLWLKWNLRVNTGVQAIRLYIVSNNLKLHWCIDCKFWASDEPFAPLVFTDQDDIIAGTEAYFNLWWDTIVQANEWDTFAIAVVISTWAGTNQEPIVKIFSSGLSWWTYDNPMWNMWERSWVSIWMEFIRDKPFDTNF